MNSKTTSGKAIGKIISKAAGTVFTVSAFALNIAGANAQVVSTPYGNLPAGATPISLSPSAPYTLNPFNTNTQNYSVFGGTNGSPYSALGYTNPYDLSGYGGLGGLGIYDIGSGSLLGSFAAMPLGSGLTFLGDNYGGGYATFGANGSIIVNPGQGYNPYLSSFNQNPYNQGMLPPNSRSANNGNNSADGSDANSSVPMPLSQAITVQRGRGFDLSVLWRGNPDRIASMKVTLLNRYHLPVAKQVTDGVAPAYFAANQNTFAARYYRVEVQYADGATAAITTPLSFSRR